jgi:hypothetical protein
MAIRPLLVEELAEIFAIRRNKTGPPAFNPAWRPGNPEEALISACSSLIAIVDRDGSRIVEFSHFTVKQFLTSDRLAASEERLSYYHILPEPAHALLAHACLSVLLQLDDKIDRNAIAHFPSPRMPRSTGSTMPSLGTSHRTFKRLWSICLILQSHILLHGSGYTTSTGIDRAHVHDKPDAT